MLVSLCCVALRWLLRIRGSARSVEGVSRTRNHRPATRTGDPSAHHAPSGDHRRRPRVTRRRQPTAAARALAIVHRDAGDAVALAPTFGRQAVDVRDSCRWRIPNRAAETPERTRIAVIELRLESVSSRVSVRDGVHGWRSIGRHFVRYRLAPRA